MFLRWFSNISRQDNYAGMSRQDNYAGVYVHKLSIHKHSVCIAVEDNYGRNERFYHDAFIMLRYILSMSAVLIPA